MKRTGWALMFVASACGEPATALFGEWQVVEATYTIQQLDFDQNVTDEQVYTAEDLGTFTFEDVPAGYGAYSFTRALTTQVDRAGLLEPDRFYEADGTPITVGYDEGFADEPGIVIYDSADEWNGDFAVTGGPTLTKQIRNEFSAEQSQIEIFEWRLGK
jgi:hypothetical protein